MRRWDGPARTLGYWSQRLRAWWLLAAAAVAGAVLAAASQRFGGVVAAALVAVGSAVAAVLAERGRAQLAVGTPAGPAPRVGRVDRAADAIRLGVRPAAPEAGDRVPPYVERDAAAALREALQCGGFVLVVGDSAAGKTRLAYEAVRAVLPRHTFVVPDGPAGVVAAVAAAQRRWRSVLWLDDLERYLGPSGLTRRLLDGLLERGASVAVVATMRAHEREQFSARGDGGAADSERHRVRAAREVLDAVTYEVRLPRLWSETELSAAGRLRDDPRIADALDRADRHGVAEHLVAAPELLRNLRDAWSPAPYTTGRHSGGRRGAALVTAAVDVRRTGYHRPVSADLLRELHELYLDPADVETATSWEKALAWATEPAYATVALLQPAGNGTYLAFDYLVDAVQEDPAAAPVPASIWPSVLELAEPDDAVEVAWRAAFAGYGEQSPQVFERAMLDRRHVAAAQFADIVDWLGRPDDAAAMLERVIAVAETDGGVSRADLLEMRRSLAWSVGEQVAGEGDPHRALRIITEVVADSVAVFGPDSERTLQARIDLARQTGGTGDPVEALRLAAETADRTAALFGPLHHQTLGADFEVAVWTRETAGAAAAIPLFEALLERARAADWVSVLLVIDCEWNLGGALIDAGRHEDAVAVLRTAASQAAQYLGDRHPRTALVRLSLADAESQAPPDAGDDGN